MVLALAGVFLASAALAEAPPQRVVSMNLCTDQLAIALAAPGQLISVSYLAHDPRSSAMVEEAAAWPVNHGLAEEIFLLQPDLVLAGSFTTRATVSMLTRLGIPVVQFEPAYSLADVRQGMLDMGRALHREAEAEAMAQQFDIDLALLHAEITHRPTAALYYASGYTSGDRTLAGQILVAAGFDNVAPRAGVSDSGVLPLERLIMANPEMVISGRPFPGASQAEELLRHPALMAQRAGRPGTGLSDRDWVCGTPYVLRAIATLREARRAMAVAE